jgi:hypothetical protein
MIVPVTEIVHPDEKCWRLKEVNLMRRIGNTNVLRRIQMAWVERNGIIWEWSRDLGPAENFTAPGCDIPAIWEHTIGECWDMADVNRMKDDYWERFLREKEHESTLFDDWRNQVMERHEIIHNRSVIGPKVRKQRNGFWRSKALEQRN